MNKKFKCLSKDINSERTEWVYYGIMSKPHVIGGSWITPDLQWTGLKDKNGKEIYEGDILYCHEYDSSDCGHRITQTFKNAVVGFHDGNYYYHPKGNMQQPHQLLMYAYQPVVIGNIYETPELLNQGAKDERSVANEAAQ